MRLAGSMVIPTAPKGVTPRIGSASSRPKITLRATPVSGVLTNHCSQSLLLPTSLYQVAAQERHYSIENDPGTESRRGNRK